MRQTTGIALLIILVTSITLRAVTMPTLVVTNQSDSMVEIIPVDADHQTQLPPAVIQVMAKLPAGSFLLVNHRSVPINAVATMWLYTDRSGNSQQRQINCNGYLALPIQSIVEPNSSTLIQLENCIKAEYLEALAAGKPFLGGRTWHSLMNNSIIENRQNLDTVRITVDSAIFADGLIWGPDIQKSYTTLWDRYWAARYVVEEVEAAKAAGEPMASRLESIRARNEGKGDKKSVNLDYFAGLLQTSPNPEGTFRLLKNMPPLPDFQHIAGGQSK